jgi:hypothetical protein
MSAPGLGYLALERSTPQRTSFKLRRDSFCTLLLTTGEDEKVRLTT